jgi:hypothetical protein
MTTKNKKLKAKQKQSRGKAKKTKAKVIAVGLWKLFSTLLQCDCNMDEADRRRNAAISNGFGKWLGIGCWGDCS